MTSPLDDLLSLLDLEQIEVNMFRGQSGDASFQRIFGGQVAAQALIAAGRTVPAERLVHSLHAYFLRPGDPDIPVVYEVDPIRDGRSFTTRRVVAIQHGKAIFNLSASFHLHEDGIEHADPMPQVVPPETLPGVEETIEQFGPADVVWPRNLNAIDVRYVTPPVWQAAGQVDPPGSETRLWMRTAGPLPDDPLVHVCAVTFASDITLLDATTRGHGIATWTRSAVIASLDHAMWFHQSFRADEWFLYTNRSPAARGARGLSSGQIFTRDGQLVVSVVQEGLIRQPRPTG